MDFFLDVFPGIVLIVYGAFMVALGVALILHHA